MTITPETKLGALLEAFPGVEDGLNAWVPPLAKLTNPVLRSTVIRTTTLGQAAGMAGVDAAELVCKVRSAVGQDSPPPEDDRPNWVSEERVRHFIDADAMLESGVHPIGKVRQCASELQPGELLCLKSSFRPVPLLETMLRSGMAVYSTEVSPGRHHTYIGPTSESRPR